MSRGGENNERQMSRTLCVCGGGVSGSESRVTGKWERWRERTPVLLKPSPLAVNRSWQHLSLTLSPYAAARL